MNFSKMTRNLVLTFIAAIAIFLSPVGNDEASASSFKSDEFKQVAQKYLGVRYVYGGTTTSGFDCSGYVRAVFGNLGVDLPRTSAAMYGVGKSVSQSELVPGDLLFFNTSGRGVSHVGLYLGGGKFIHSQTGKGVSITALNDPWYWGSKYIGAKRVASVSFN